MDERELSREEREKVEAAYSYGVEEVTPADLDKVLENPSAVEKRASRLGKLFPDFLTLWELLKDYRKGDYPSVPWRFIGAIIFAVTYLVAPIDVIPDFIPGVGFIDDAAIFALVIKGFSADLERYKQWKHKNSIKE